MTTSPETPQGRGRRPNHERVYRVLQAAGAPLTAYAILDALRPEGVTAPTTVYRALDGLMAKGLAHRLDSINAYVACADPDHRHGSAVFAICEACGLIDELLEHSTIRTLIRSTEKHGFRVRQATIELKGRCAKCDDPPSADRVAAKA